MDKDIEQSTSIRFKPMSEGLGLNHFADGLPYTPVHAKKKPTVQFSYPPRGPLSSPQGQNGLGATAAKSRQNPTMAQAPVGTEGARKLIEEFELEATGESESSEPLCAGFIRRVFAYLLDLVFSTAMFGGIVWTSFRLNGYDVAALLREERGLQIIGPLALLYVVVHVGYFLIQETTWRRTIGKAIVGIRIRSTSGFATLGRSVCFFVAAIPLGIGLLWYFFDSRHRCWHDVITDSEVVLN